MLSSNETKALNDGLIPLSTALKNTIDEASVITLYDEFSASLIDAEHKNLIVGLPHQAKEKISYDKERLHSICDRLFNLGYLTHHVLTRQLRSKRVNKNLKIAIKKFQKESGLPADGIVGSKTWLALQQLITFEEPTQIHLWLTDEGQPKLPLKRAIQLRLYTLGINKFKPTLASPPITPNLSKFKGVCLNFGFFNKNKPITDNDLLMLLFDQDRLVRYLGQSKLDLAGNQDKIAQQFLLSVTKIELWLLNTKKITPNGRLTETHTFKVGPKRGQPRQITVIRANGKELHTVSYFYQGVKNIWKSLGENDNRNKAKKFLTTYPDFFRSLDELEQTDETAINASVEDFINQDVDNIKSLWSTAKTFMGKLFDGLKRIGRFFKTLFSLAIDNIKLLARPFYNLVVNGFNTIQTAITATIEGLKLYFSESISFAGNNSAFAFKEKDCDLSVLVDRNNVSEVSAFNQNLILITQRLKAASSLLSTFLQLLKIIFTTAVTGWWAFFKACVGLYRNHNKLIQALNFLNQNKLLSN